MKSISEQVDALVLFAIDGLSEQYDDVNADKVENFVVRSMTGLTNSYAEFVFDGDEPIGFVFGILNDPPFEDGSVAVLMEAYVVPEWRVKGGFEVGYKLLDLFEQWATDKEADSIAFSTHEPFISRLKKRGYETTLTMFEKTL